MASSDKQDLQATSEGRIERGIPIEINATPKNYLPGKSTATWTVEMIEALIPIHISEQFVFELTEVWVRHKRIRKAGLKIIEKSQ